MSKPWLPRQPARPELGQDGLAETAVPDDLAREITTAVGQSGLLSRLGPVGDAPHGYYRLRPEGGAPDLFIKLVPAAQAARQEQANRMARYLADGGVATNCLLPGFPWAFGVTAAILAYPFVEGRLPRATPEDLAAIGVAVANMHQRLATAPLADRVREEGETRRAMLRARQAAIVAAAEPPGPNPEALRTVMTASPEAFAPNDGPCQVIHGDLNPGNILVRDTGEVVFLDFEDSLVAWLPQRVDLAMLLERLVLLSVTDNAAAVDLGHTFLSAYRSASDTCPFAAQGQLAETLNWLALRSFALLAEFTAKGEPWPDSEWQKFMHLIELAKRRQAVIAAIEAPFAG